MKEEKMTKGEKYFWIGFIVGGIVITIVASVLFGTLSIDKEYIRAQGIETCELSNNYRGLAITIKPEYEFILPPELNCNKIFAKSLKGRLADE